MKTTKKSTITFSPQDVKKIAALANIPVTPAEEQKLVPQLASILSFVSELQKVSTEHIEPTNQVTGLINVFREDEINTARMLSQEEALKNVKAKHNGFFIVPAIFK